MRNLGIAILFGSSLQKAKIRSAMRLGEIHRSGPEARNHLRHVSLFQLIAALDQERGDRSGSEALIHFKAVVGR